MNGVGVPGAPDQLQQGESAFLWGARGGQPLASWAYLRLWALSCRLGGRERGMVK